MLSLENKTIVVTGASSGLGRSISISISKMKGKVVMIARDEERLEETSNMLDGDGHSYRKFNLLDFSEIKQLMSSVIKEHGKIDGLVHAAGIESTTPLKALSYKSLDEIFKINVYAGIELTKHFTKKDNFNSSGSIVFLSSVMGSLGEKGKIAYCGTKAAIKNMVKPLALELAVKEIRVNSISPGLVMTPMTEKLFLSITEKNIEEIKGKHPLGLGEPKDVAALCVFLLSNSSKWITGTDITIDGGYSIS